MADYDFESKYILYDEEDDEESYDVCFIEIHWVFYSKIKNLIYSLFFVYIFYKFKKVRYF